MSINAEKDYYAILGVLPSAESVVIRAAYKALAQHYHPDRYTGSSDEAHKMMCEINEAYKVLSNPEMRKEYDELRGERAKDASSFFDDSCSSDGTVNTTLDNDWKTALDFYPDLSDISKRLSKISLRLIFTYKLCLLETKEFDQRLKLAKLLERQFLEQFFGTNEEVLQFAQELIFSGKKHAAKDLNNAIRVLGSSSNPLLIINRIKEKHNIDYTQSVEPLSILLSKYRASSTEDLMSKLNVRYENGAYYFGAMPFDTFIEAANVADKNHVF